MYLYFLKKLSNFVGIAGFEANFSKRLETAVERLREILDVAKSDDSKVTQHLAELRNLQRTVAALMFSCDLRPGPVCGAWRPRASSSWQARTAWPAARSCSWRWQVAARETVALLDEATELVAVRRTARADGSVSLSVLRRELRDEDAAKESQ